MKKYEKQAIQMKFKLCKWKIVKIQMNFNKLYMKKE